MDDLTDAFVAESEEAISALNAGLLELEGDPDDEEAMDSVFRTAHTLKGNAGAMGFSTAANLAHALENLLDGMRQGDVPVTGETMDAAFAGVDEFEAMIDEVAETGEIARDPTEAVAEIERVVRETDPVDASDEAATADSESDGDTEDAESTDVEDRPADDVESTGESTDDEDPAVTADDTAGGESEDPLDAFVEEAGADERSPAATVADTAEASDSGVGETTDTDDADASDTAGDDAPPATATTDPGDEFFDPANDQMADDDTSEPTDDSAGATGESESPPTATGDEPSTQTATGDEPSTTTDDSESPFPTPTEAETEALRETAGDPDGPARHVRLSVLGGDFPEIDGSLAMDGVAGEVDVLGADPDSTAIREGDFESPVDLLVESDADPDDLAETLEGIPRIETAVAVLAGDVAADAEAVQQYREARAEATGEADGDATGDDGARVQSVRVDVDTLDTLYGLVEELVTSRIRLRGAVESGDLDNAQQELDALETATGDLQDTVMDARLVPLSTVASTLPRVVRDTARECGKEVSLETDGEDVEMDRDVLEAIGDPLIHIVRNAVDHGIEPPEIRESKGKPREGTVELSAWRSRDRVTVEVSDDGSGLDPDALRETAVERGTLDPEEAAAMSDTAARELVFEPGFSTAGEVTEVSGRGVGMDVVASTLRELDGRVEIESEPDEGTTVRLRLPVSVAIARTLFVEVGDEEFGVPVSAVEEIGRLTETRTVEGREVVPIDGELYPLVRLGDALDVAGRVEGEMLVRARSSVRQVALGVDAVAGQEEVVIKPFDGVLEGIPGLSGATVLGEGRVVPVLDVETL
ncbi:chemotaxis protein CheA [Salinirubrum litoreum]|uniref:Chemotaxis protein CheA n=1 Tax=Salinirubrum litoreum TaxID=1126234 RepID=A0ABD5R7P2_9EURY|nr:chemotaxis protein CheA [Salinirubrum litoreum]